MTVPGGPHPRRELAFEIAARLLGVVGLGVAVYSWFAYTGPYRWFAELEIAGFGGYHPLFVGALTLLSLTLVPVALLHLLLVRLRVIEALEPAKLSVSRAPGGDTQGSRSTLAYILAGLLCCGFCAAGVIQLWHGRGGDDHETHAVADLAGREPKARWVTLSGRLASEAAFSYVERGTRDIEHEYVPLVPMNWTPSEPVRFVVEYRCDGSECEPHAGGAASVTGTLHGSGVPGFLRERANLRLAHQHYVLVPGKVPRQTKASGFSLIGLGFLLGGLIAGVTALCYRIAKVGS